jgi:uncharacterized protein YecT (DUF1311 family)
MTLEVKMKRYFGMMPALLALLVAAEPKADPIMECGNQFGSQIEIGDCLADVEKNADATMEIALGFAMEAAKDLDTVTEREVAVPALEAGQAAWSAYRDQHCEYVGSTFGGGSGTGIAMRGCRIELARARTDVLMKFTN